MERLRRQLREAFAKKFDVKVEHSPRIDEVRRYLSTTRNAIQPIAERTSSATSREPTFVELQSIALVRASSQSDQRVAKRAVILLARKLCIDREDDPPGCIFT